MSAATDQTRIGVIDMARCYAIALVFYGHFIEEFMLLKNAAGASQYKFIYSFHMVLFVVIAGYVAKEAEIDLGVGRFLKHRFFTRLLPYIFFTGVMMIPTIFLTVNFTGSSCPRSKAMPRACSTPPSACPLFAFPPGSCCSSSVLNWFTSAPSVS